MYNESQIIITAVANGWIVQMPEQDSIQNNEAMRLMKEAGKIFGKTMNADPLLSQLQSEDDTKKDNHTPTVVSRNETQHIFKTFGEVLAFLEVMIDE